MSKTTKTVVIVGVAAILLFVIINMSQPKVVNSTTNSSGAGYLPGLFALGAGLGKALSSSPPAVSTPYDNAPGQVVSQSDFQTQEQKDAAAALSATPFFGSVF